MAKRLELGTVVGHKFIFFSFFFFESQRPSSNSAAAFLVISFHVLSSEKFLFLCLYIFKLCFLGPGMCLSEPQACLPTPIVHSVCPWAPPEMVSRQVPCLFLG